MFCHFLASIIVQSKCHLFLQGFQLICKSFSNGFSIQLLQGYQHHCPSCTFNNRRNSLFMIFTQNKITPSQCSGMIMSSTSLGRSCILILSEIVHVYPNWDYLSFWAFSFTSGIRSTPLEAPLWEVFTGRHKWFHGSFAHSYFLGSFASTPC